MTTLDQQTSATLRQVTRLHYQLQQHSVNCCNINLTRCHILTELGPSGELSLKDLVSRLNLDKGFLSRTIEAMQEEGLVQKKAHPTDRRVVNITLTETGLKQHQALQDTLNGHTRKVLRHIPEKSREIVLRALEILEDAMRTELADIQTPCERKNP